MAATNGSGAVIAGIGATPYYPRGTSWPQTTTELICKAMLAAAEDAGLPVTAIDGLALYSTSMAGYTEFIEPASIMETLGIPEVTFTTTLTGGGGGSAGAIGLAAAALAAGEANYIVTVMGLQQARRESRLGKVFLAKPQTPESSFLTPSGIAGPGHLMAMLARRHMYKYGTRREAFAEIAITERDNACKQPGALKRTPLTREEYFRAPMLADPLCIYDFCLETDGAVAVITTTADRARDLRQKPIHVVGATHGGERTWGRAFTWMNMPDDVFASSGHRSTAKRLYQRTGVKPSNIDVACMYDHFSPMVLMQLEDYGFCSVGEGGPFVESGAIRMNGTIPVNPHGGQLSEGYVIGMTHIIEAVRQLRGTANNQVPDAETALVTGAPASIPVSGLILRRS
jgi:acetyl-CoA acetyltransferase